MILAIWVKLTSIYLYFEAKSVVHYLKQKKMHEKPINMVVATMSA